jgi:glutamine phosphoribosylpyrophosphate amidotransferase
VKEKGVSLPSKSVLETCFQNNPDGAGIMFVRGGKVVIDKGHMKFEDFWRAYRSHKLTKDDTIVFHFRIATAGRIRPANCHPFPISADIKSLTALKFNSDVAMAHNGVIGHGEGDISDTMVFVRDVLAEALVRENLENPAIIELIEGYIGNSRVVILKADGSLLFYGYDWVKEYDDGMIFSNFSFRPNYKRAVRKSWDD